MASAIFFVSAAFLGYVMAGYPLLLGWLARRRARPIERRFVPRTVSILLPVRNGAAWIEAKLRTLAALDYPPGLIEILVISDGSGDATEALVEKARAADPRIHLLRIKPSGKAAALNLAMERATGEILFFTDVRQELEPASLRNLVACLGDPAVGVASGELIIRAGNSLEEAHVGLYWRYEKWIRKHLSALDSVPGATGCIYAMRAALAHKLAPDTILDDVNLPLGAFFAGYRVIFDETARAYDAPSSLDTEFRRKVRTQAGVYQTLRAFPALLGPRNRIWLHFVSHKLGRLLLPWALAALAASSYFLPAPWRTLAIAGQAAFYALAILDRSIPERWPVKRLSSPVRTFVVLMAAALAAVSILFVPPRTLWRETRLPRKG
jgi:poly-beta-1,6-N-acetyl-D-glucosamine synthase